MNHQIVVRHIDELDKAAEKLLKICKSDKIFAFYGKMGVGKTTFIQRVCHLLGVIDNITSPSFAIVNEYAGNNQIYHIDAYRLKNINEAANIGLEEYFLKGIYCFIEWPSKIEPLLPNNTVKVHLQEKFDKTRIITIEK